MDYEAYELDDGTPTSVIKDRMFNCGFYHCPKPAYAVEVNSNEDENLHPGYLGDFVLPDAS